MELSKPEQKLQKLTLDLEDQSGGVHSLTVGVFCDDALQPPSIEIFEVKENEGVSASEYIFLLTPALRAHFLPDMALDDILWKITNNHMRVDFMPHEIDEKLVCVDFPQGIPFSRPFMSLSDFDAALSAPEGYDMRYKEHFNGLVGGGMGSPRSIIAVPVPEHPAQVRYMSFQHHENNQLVLADVRRFMPDWEIQDKEYGQKDRWDIFHSDVETAIRYTPINVEDQFERTMPIWALYSTGEGGFAIAGRHRTANLATLGAPFVPVSVESSMDAKAFRQCYEYKGAQPKASRANNDNLLTENFEL